jgi:hypothetical protein
VHDFPDTHYGVQIGAVGWQEVQLDARVFSGPFLYGGTGMIPLLTQNDV